MIALAAGSNDNDSLQAVLVFSQLMPLALIVVAIWSMFVSTCSVVFQFFVARAAVLAL